MCHMQKICVFDKLPAVGHAFNVNESIIYVKYGAFK